MPIAMLLLGVLSFYPGSHKPDTTFLLRETGKDYYHTVYIEKNRQSEAYRHLINFKMSDDEKIDYLDVCRNLTQKVKHPLAKRHLTGLPSQWIPIYLYHNRYYLYHPSEDGNKDRRIITDSTVVYWSMESPYPEVLKLQHHSGNTYVFKTSHYMQGQPASKLVIHIIDPVNQIAVWEDASQSGAYHYGLYISREKARNLDMIVNYCRQSKAPEFQFDRINYASLLKRR